MRMLLKSSNDVFPKPLPPHSIVADKEFETSTAKTADSRNSFTIASNDNPSTLEYSKEINLKNSTNGPSKPQKITPLNLQE